nr:MAG TPA: hypothetical protein [Caudoviricetes sp.]
MMMLARTTSRGVPSYVATLVLIPTPSTRRTGQEPLPSPYGWKKEKASSYSVL